MAGRGISIRAANKPISSYPRKPGERYGHHWYIPNVARTREFPYRAIDANCWKTFFHERMMIAVGDRSSLSIFGKQPNRHRLLAEHIANSEVWLKTEGYGRVVHEWKITDIG